MHLPVISDYIIMQMSIMLQVQVVYCHSDVHVHLCENLMLGQKLHDIYIVANEGLAALATDQKCSQTASSHNGLSLTRAFIGTVHGTEFNLLPLPEVELIFSWLSVETHHTRQNTHRQFRIRQ